MTLLSMDSFYKVLSHEQHELAATNAYNFDHPDAFDFELVTIHKIYIGDQKSDLSNSRNI